MPNQLLRLIVLDCDGTMVNSLTTIVNTMAESFIKNGLEPPQLGKVRQIVGLHLGDAIKVLVSREDIHLIDTLVNTYREVVANYRTAGHSEDPLYPDAKDTIQALDADGWLLGVATGKSMKGLDAVLRFHDIRHYFSTIQTSDIGPGKPAPDMLLRAMLETGTEPENTVMIGDTTFDMEMAKNAGTHSIGVSWGYHGEDKLITAGAHHIIHRYTELSDALDNLFTPEVLNR